VGFLELIGALRRRSGDTQAPFLLRLALPAAALAVAAAVLPAASAASVAPRPKGLRCIEGCAGMQAAAVDSIVAITGDRLNHVSRIQFRGRSGSVAAMPAKAGRHRLTVEIPAGAVGGRPRVVTPRGARARVPKLLRIVSPARLPGRRSFDVIRANAGPRQGFVDDGRTHRLRYRFRAYGRRTVLVKLRRGGHAVRRWKLRNVLPYTAHRIEWRGLDSHGNPAPPGRYRFTIASPHHRPTLIATFRLFGGKFPIRGRHGYGGPVQRFGAPRSGGRVHQGQDVFAACGTRVVAAVGGRVQARGTDRVLYGNWAVIDARGTHTDYRYAHFLHPATVHRGERVRTGDEIGRIGKTGNARSVGCMLHFEVWPNGWNRDSPVDPLPILERWDGWS
jgi:murein DD-endopeptidase MepM/ murein hydrolase activator NlpD